MITLEKLLKQHAFWKYFFELSSIPRPSFNQEKACEWVISYAQQWNLSYKRDEYGNIAVCVPANNKELSSLPLVAIQAHLDMVCEKNDVEHDFTQDPLQLYVTEDQTYIKAKDTTLGADDGIGVAYQIALMDPSCEYSHGPLEILFTLDEEVGLIGASKLAKGMLKAKYLINIDNSREGMCCNGCAGGKDIIAEVPILRESVPKEYTAFLELKIKGLSGGHSGSDIFELRANAIKLMERVLSEIHEQSRIYIANIKSGDKHNAIPREATVQFYAKEEDVDAITHMLSELQRAIRHELLDIDRNFTIVLQGVLQVQEKAAHEKYTESSLVFSESSLLLMIKLIRYYPHGVLMRRNSESSGTTLSTNLASVQTRDASVVFATSVRFANEYGKKHVVRVAEDYFRAVDAKCSTSSGYEAWEVSENSSLETLFCSQYELYTHKKAVVDVIHGGLECGIIRSTQEQSLDAISIGPDVDFLHSPSERMHIESCNTMWHVIGNMLGAAKELI